MSFFHGLRHRLRAWFRPSAWQRDLNQEIRNHLELEAMQQEHAGQGALPKDAVALAARRRFGNVTWIQEETRRMSGLGFFDVLRQDLRFALTSFLRTPAFTAVAVLTLAVGIGANTAIFSAVNTLLLRPLPFPEPARLMKPMLTVPPGPNAPAPSDVVWSYPKFALYRDAQRSFQEIALWTDAQQTIRIGDETERVWAELIGARYLPALGITPIRGRNILPAEDQHGDGPRVALVSDNFWSTRFQRDPDVLGRTLRVGGHEFTIVGVLPPGFGGLSGRAELFLSFMSQPAEEINQAWSHSYYAIARLLPGVTADQATQEAELLGKQIDAAYPDNQGPSGGGHWGATAVLLDATRVDPRVRRSVLVLLGAVALVLLIACGNVANLFLVRAAGRRREIAVRLAVGAGRRRLIRQLLTESMALSLLGGILGLALAWLGVRTLSGINPGSALRAQQLTGLGTVTFQSIHLDAIAFWFALGLSLLTGLAFGLVPALSATRPSLTGALKDGVAERPRRRFLQSRNVLAAGEIALALVLLAGSGLMFRSLARLLALEPGFDARNVLTLRLNAPENYTRDSLPGFYDQLLERMRALPGVIGAALGECPPLNGGCNWTNMALRDRPPAPPGQDPSIAVHWITPTWHQTLGVPLLRGRSFTDADRLGVRKVVLINRTAAERIWPGQEALGRPVSVGQGGFWRDTALVVGIVGDVRHATLEAPLEPHVYLPFYQSPRANMLLFLRTAGDPLAVARPAREAIRELASGIPVYSVRTLESVAADAMSYARFSALLLSLFGAIALSLATLGVYGVLSFAVAHRSREIGIRVALGAARGKVVRMVVGEGLQLAALGGVVGIGGALLATKVLRSLLYEVEPSDPTTFVAITVVAGAAALLASWIPARRAARVDPVVSLKTE